MPSVSTLLKTLVVLAPLAAAVPANYPRQAGSSTTAASPSKTKSAGASQPTITESASGNGTSSSTATTASTKGKSGLSDIDILNFALTAEHLESAFYKQGFAKFQMSDFTALGLDQSQVQSIMNVGMTEAVHVTTLQGAISGAGGKPVEPCDYNFDAALASADSMVKTARVLEAIGIGAYLGAAPLINSSDVLSAAGSIVTVEARHQALLRLANKAEGVPAAFDVALTPTAVFTLASPFIKSCPAGSDLGITPFPAIALQNPDKAAIGTNLKLQDPAQPNGASFCAFIAPGGNKYSPITSGQCAVPDGLAGEVFMMITKSQSVADSEVLAGPAVIQPS